MKIGEKFEKNVFVKLIIVVGVAAALLIPGIGNFGMWEPNETDHARVADSIADGRRIPSDLKIIPRVEERVVALSWSVFDRSELTARLPIACAGIIAAAALFLMLCSIAAKPQISMFAALALLFSPVFIFHSRQVTSGVFVLLSEIFATLGLMLLAYGKKPFLVYLAAVVSIAGLAIGWLDTGLLLGVAAPAGTVSIAIAMSKAKNDTIWSISGRSAYVMWLGALLAVFAAAIFFAGAFGGDNSLLITGLRSKALLPKTSFDVSLRLLAYGWFPWSCIALIGILRFFTTSAAKDSDRETTLLYNLALSGLAVGYVAHVVFVKTEGVIPLFLAVPMSLSAALAIDDLLKKKAPSLLTAFIFISAAAVLARDFVQEPKAILSSYAFEKIDPPKGFQPGYEIIAFAAPLILFILALNLTGSSKELIASIRKKITFPLVILGGVLFAGYISFALIPQLSKHLSSKHTLDSYEKMRKGDEPLGIYDATGMTSKGKRLRTEGEVLDWLSTSKRVFAVFPPKYLASLNKSMREQTGQHMIILDDSSSNLMLAVSVAKPQEKNLNPIVRFIKSTPFDPGPSHNMSVNFDDKVTFLGFDIQGPNQSEDLAAGEQGIISTYWRCDQRIGSDYKMFIHIDGQGGRINGDHEPVKGVYATGLWAPQDYIKDEYQIKLPIYQKKGYYTVEIGFFNGAGRLAIKDYPAAVQNAVKLTKIRIR